VNFQRAGVKISRLGRGDFLPSGLYRRRRNSTGSILPQGGAD
jgi:hypothetical protein